MLLQIIGRFAISTGSLRAFAVSAGKLDEALGFDIHLGAIVWRLLEESSLNWHTSAGRWNVCSFEWKLQGICSIGRGIGRGVGA